MDSLKLSTFCSSKYHYGINISNNPIRNISLQIEMSFYNLTERYCYTQIWYWLKPYNLNDTVRIFQPQRIKPAWIRILSGWHARDCGMTMEDHYFAIRDSLVGAGR